MITSDEREQVFVLIFHFEVELRLYKMRGQAMPIQGFLAYRHKESAASGEILKNNTLSYRVCLPLRKSR